MNHAAQVIKDKSQEILAQWEKMANRKIEASRYADSIVLRDHLPEMLNDITDILIRHDSLVDVSKDEKYFEIVSNSTDHGRHRATSEKYTVDQIIHEYIIFHRAITLVLRINNAYNVEVADLLKYIVETAMLQSAASFSISLQETQEKMIGTLAHDIRSPLMNIHSLVELMSHETKKEKFETFRRMVLRSVQKALKLTEGLLDSITIKAGEGIMLTFAEANVAEIVTLIYREAREIYSQEIKLECPVREIIAVVDEVAIRRLLENLLTNAIKYGDARRPITIKVVEADEAISISVHNYGSPISPEKQQSIFSFLHHSKQQDAANRRSWGMGLTLTKTVAESHGGTVSLKSSEEDGTLFTITLNKNNEVGKRRTRVLSNFRMPT